MEKYLKNYAPVLSVDEVAEILSVTPRTVRQLTNNGTISSVKIGRIIRIPKDKLINFLENK